MENKAITCVTQDHINDWVTDINSNENIIWAPIRHHSPQCSWQLQQLIQQQSPDVILIEGPTEANHLLPYLFDENTQAPVAVYIYAVTEKRHRCFVPFADMSPEWVGLKEGHKNNIDVEFIDLPYAQRLEFLGSEENVWQGQDELLNNDRLLTENDFMQSLVETAGCRDFDEWWDRNFEAARNISSTDFFNNVMMYCLMLRSYSTNRSEHNEAETLSREAFMAEKIRPHLESGKRCLVICGGYHCLGIHQHLQKKRTASKPALAALKEQGVYLIPYTLDRLNSASGYGAGMPDIGYYQGLWQALTQKKKNTHYSSFQPADVYSELHFRYCAALVKAYRDKSFLVTTPDAIEAGVMIQRLAQLRGGAAGRVEFRDAITSCYYKQSRDGSESFFDDILNNFLSGNLTGILPASLPLAPLVDDFKYRCQLYKLPLILAESLEKVLNIYRSEKHRKISHFFHQLQFLKIPYADFIVGPKFASGEDLERVREVWRVKWCVETQTQLTECAYLGSSVAEAALNCIKQKLRAESTGGPEKISLLLSALSMGLHSMLTSIEQDILIWIRQETQLLPLCLGIQQLALCFYARSALEAQDLVQLKSILILCFERICARLSWVSKLSAEDSEYLSEALVDMSGLVTIEAEFCDQELFFDGLKTVLETTDNPQLLGVVSGILTVRKQLGIGAACEIFKRVFAYSNLDPNHIGEFLRGFLRLAKSSFSAEPALLSMFNEQVGLWDEEEFLNVLPSLRLAFTQLSPREVRLLTQQFFTDEDDLDSVMCAKQWPVTTLLQANRLANRLTQSSQYWGLFND